MLAGPDLRVIWDDPWKSRLVKQRSLVLLTKQAVRPVVGPLHYGPRPMQVVTLGGGIQTVGVSYVMT